MSNPCKSCFLILHSLQMMRYVPNGNNFQSPLFQACLVMQIYTCVRTSLHTARSQTCFHEMGQWEHVFCVCVCVFVCLCVCVCWFMLCFFSLCQLIQFLFSQMQSNTPSTVGLKRKLWVHARACTQTHTHTRIHSGAINKSETNRATVGQREGLAQLTNWTI